MYIIMQMCVLCSFKQSEIKHTQTDTDAIGECCQRQWDVDRQTERWILTHLKSHWVLKLSIYTSFDDLAIYKSNSFRLLLSTDFSGRCSYMKSHTVGCLQSAFDWLLYIYEIEFYYACLCIEKEKEREIRTPEIYFILNCLRLLYQNEFRSIRLSKNRV